MEENVMDTPERGKNNQTPTSITKFEDSPVFNFINSLSPIKPLKSMPITQSINHHLTFASIPSVFTSPHVSECRRYQLSDPSRPEFSSGDTNTVKENRINMNADNKIYDHKENLDPTASSCEVANEPSYEECSKLIVDFSENLEYSNISSSNLNNVDQNREAMPSCDWLDLISDPSDFLIFGSADDKKLRDEPVDPALSFYTSIKHAIQNTLSRGPVVSENLFTQPEEDGEMITCGEVLDMNGGPSIPHKNMDHQHLSGLYRGRGVRRRSLVFDMAGARLNHFTDKSSSDSSILQHWDENISPNQQQVPSFSQRALPGIGLHLNALSTTLIDYNIVNLDSSASRRLLIGPCPSTSSEFDNTKNSGLPLEDSFRECLYVENEEIKTSSPKKKRRRLEQAGEIEAACKRCNCKKSRCLKLYCECFAAGVYCIEPCACIDCFNKPVHEDTVLATRKQIESRNPLAFAPKVIRGSDTSSETVDDFSKTPASARHKRGCNCKKSGCLKKYCECYQGGAGCSINCRCEGCKNAFGRKDGSGSLKTDREFEEGETNTSEKAEADRSSRKITIQDNLDQYIDYALPATPLKTGSQLSQLSSSKKRPPRFSFSSISSSSFSGSQEFGKSTSALPPPGPRPPPQYNQTVDDDEMPEFLLERSTNSGIISLSPNGKRVSPPQHRARSPGMRSSRKLILQSIPSFPCLTNNR